jgi:hypothetical protein
VTLQQDFGTPYTTWTLKANFLEVQVVNYGIAEPPLRITTIHEECFISKAIATSYEDHWSQGIF